MKPEEYDVMMDGKATSEAKLREKIEDYLMDVKSQWDDENSDLYIHSKGYLSYTEVANHILALIKHKVEGKPPLLSDKEFLLNLEMQDERTSPMIPDIIARCRCIAQAQRDADVRYGNEIR